jgi:hypothetical protein
MNYEEIRRAQVLHSIYHCTEIATNYAYCGMQRQARNDEYDDW